jgi:hypothetical protein
VVLRDACNIFRSLMSLLEIFKGIRPDDSRSGPYRLSDSSARQPIYCSTACREKVNILRA